GSVVTSGEEFVQTLVSQVTSPVRWDLCMATLLDRNVEGIIEVAPAGTLVGLAKRAMRGVPGTAINTPEDLDALKA
ncbi:MAG: ACP S-malonyltransferase, partial [Rothia mucilaginosa]|nr:ACP S-malonyltransferase [Rothia mucilaginosa]